MVEAVVFDLFETLVTESAMQPTRAARLGPTLGLEPEAYRTQWKAVRPLVVRGQLSFVEALTEISQVLAGKADADAIQQIREQRIREKAAVYKNIDAQIQALVDDLHGRGVALGVISNGFEEDVLGWSTCTLAPAFQCALFSCVEGVAKPDPEIYRRALRRLRAQPEAAMYIGDGADNELMGAEEAGLRLFRAAWFTKDRPNVRSSDPPGLVLADCRDVLKLVTAG